MTMTAPEKLAPEVILSWLRNEIEGAVMSPSRRAMMRAAADLIDRLSAPQQVTEEMVEMVARLICDEENPGHWDDAADHVRSLYRGFARRLLAAALSPKETT